MFEKSDSKKQLMIQQSNIITNVNIDKALKSQSNLSLIQNKQPAKLKMKINVVSNEQLESEKFGEG